MLHLFFLFSCPKIISATERSEEKEEAPIFPACIFEGGDTESVVILLCLVDQRDLRTVNHCCFM